MKPFFSFLAFACLLTGLIAISPAATSRVPAASPASVPAKGRAEHVVIVVWDGLRPDTINEQDTPTLFRLGQRGTRFQSNHCVYISSTEVNGTAIATGCYPRHDGIVGNNEYRPAIDSEKPVNTESLEAVRKGDELTGGHYVMAETMVERAQRAGLPTVVAGTKPVALLQDRRDRTDASASPILFEGKTLPATALHAVTDALGPFPKPIDSKKSANTAEDTWTTKALTDVLWADKLPAVSVLWLSEPDFAQHAAGPNSSVARQALHSSDDCLAQVLAAIEKRGLRDKTDVIIVSDHGFSTIGRAIDLAEILNDAGFHASRSFKKGKPGTGETMVVGLGGTSFLYITDHDKRTAQRITEYLQSSDITGVIFSRYPFDGTFPLEAARIDTADAPDLVVSLRWSDEPSKLGLIGLDTSDPTKRGVGQGIHASLSRYDMHNTLLAAGPDFRAGWVDKLPTGNVDVAPTVLSILGLESAQPIDGRVLSEAMVDRKAPDFDPTYEKLEGHAKSGDNVWRQYLRTVKFGPSFYIEEGNGEQSKAKSGDGSRE